MRSYTLARGNGTRSSPPRSQWWSTLLPLAGLTGLWGALLAVAVNLRRWPEGWITWIPWGILALLTGLLLGAWLVVARWAWNALQDWRWIRLEVKSLAEMQALSPAEFEAYVGRVFERQGYRVRNVPDQKDHGVDLEVISPDRRRGVVQCKRYHATVGEPQVRDFYGAMHHVGADMGFIVTTSRFSRPARRWAQGKPLELIDGPRLVRMAHIECKSKEDTR